MKYNIDLQIIADNLGFELSDIEMLIGMFVEASNDSLTQMKTAIETNDYPAIAASAHAIKGSAANIILNDITNIAEIIEHSANETSTIDYMSKYEELKLLVNNIIN
jgi:HPt (histidine-containing phosphotransfer) domain-containing protein